MKRLHTLSGLITVISLFLSVIWLTPVYAAAPVFTSLGQMTAEGLQVPGAMDLDEAGNLYVADARGGMVHKFDKYGRMLQSFDLDTSGAGLAVKPSETEVPSGYLYIARAQSVIIFNADSGAIAGELAGAVAAGTPEFGTVGDIDVDAYGNVFVVDAGNMQVKIYDASGQYQGSFGQAGRYAGEFSQIGGMAIAPSGKIVVADSSSVNGKVQVFDLNTDFSVANIASYSKLSTLNFGTPYMHTPRGIAFDEQGRGYFLEYMTSEIRVVDQGFSYLGTYSSEGYEVGQLNNVIDLAFDDANDRLFVGCDSGRIEILGVDGGSNPEYVNHAPTTPSPLTPVAGSEVSSITPTLVVSNASDEDGDPLTYHVAVSQGETVVYQADVPADAGETTSVVVDVELDENAAYSWTVQASDGDKSSSVSSSANFVVNAIEEAPSVPGLIAPVNGELIAGRDTLSWTSSTDPDPNDNDISYQIEVALDDAFAEVVAVESLTGTSLSLSSLADYGDLEDGVGYYWRAAALDSGQKMSAPSDAGQFVYDTTALTITANMPGAMVSFYGNHAFAGQPVGVAPVELRDFDASTLSVVVERPGFEPFVASVTLTEGDNVNLHAELVPAKVVNERTPQRRGINGRDGLAVSGAAAPFLVDFNNDGTLDLLVGDGSGQITLYTDMQSPRLRKINFNTGVSLGLPVMPGAIPFVADWNNDGRKDLLVGLADGSVKLFINNGLEAAPAFGAGVDLQAAGSTLSVGSNAAPAVTDYNGDGAKDLVVGNAAGEILLFLNLGSDDMPVLADSTKLYRGKHAVVPFIVDWDADGQLDLLVTTNGRIKVLSQIDGVYQKVQMFNDKVVDYSAAFPITLNRLGKLLLVGQSDGQLALLTGKSLEYTASFYSALQDKVDELGGLVAEAAPELLADITTISSLIDAGDFAGAAVVADSVALGLPVGSAQTSALELRDLLQNI